VLLEANYIIVVYAVDAKINFDDNAEFRQKQVYVDRDTTEEDPREVEVRTFAPSALARIS